MRPVQEGSTAWQRDIVERDGNKDNNDNDGIAPEALNAGVEHNIVRSTVRFV